MQEAKAYKIRVSSSQQTMVATWDDNDEQSIDEEQPHEMSNLAIKQLDMNHFDKINQVNDLSSYDELFKVFKKIA